MKSKLILVVAILTATMSLAQQATPSILASNGGTGQADGLQLDWTLGEIAISGSSGNTLSCTEGFHQPFLAVQRIEPADIGLDLAAAQAEPPWISVAPNPVTSELKIQFSQVASEMLICTLLRSDGSVMLRKELDPQLGDAALDLSGMASGYYILQFHAADGAQYPVFRISKIQ